MSLLLAGAAAGKPIMEPVEVKGSGKIGPTGVDHYAAATVKFENDIVAELICGMSCQVPSELTIYGTDGMLHVPDPWLLSAPTRYAENPLPLDTNFPSSSIFLHEYETQKEEEFTIQVDRDLFVYEADSTAENIVNRQSPAMTWEDSLMNMKLLDRWLEEVGVNYVEE